MLTHWHIIHHCTCQASLLLLLLFQVNTKACTLVVNGARRDSYNIISTCQSGYNPPDVAHDPSLPFHKITRAIWSWEKATFGCAAGSCAHVQFHGMAADSCTSSEIFLSAGTGVTTW
jgi:hypothetical protein